MTDTLIAATSPDSPPLPSPQAAAARLAWLFRDARHQAEVHPLQPVLAQYRGLGDAADMPLPTTAGSPPMSGAHRPAPTPAPNVHVDHWQSLPSLPQGVLDMQLALSREDVSLDALAEAISHDQALAAKALRLANCSFYGLSHRVSSIRQAIGILGLRSVAALLTAAAISERFARMACPGFDLAHHWRHALATALCARELALQVNLDADVAFTAGLLHDLGQLAMASQMPQPMAAALQRRQELDCLSLEAERQVLGTDHALLGAEVGAQWHFGAEVMHAIRWHHAPPEAERATVTDVVHVANSMAHALDLAQDPREMVPPLQPQAWARLGLQPAQCLPVLAHAETELDSLCEALAV